MFSSISWQSYISLLAVVLVVYYAFVLYVYYRKDIVQVLTQGGYKGEKRIIENSETAVSDAADHCEDEVKALIHQAGYSRLSKDEILFSLQQLLHSGRFETMQDPSFKKRLGKVITYECQSNCSMHLSEEDLEQVWVSK